MSKKLAPIWLPHCPSCIIGKAILIWIQNLYFWNVVNNKKNNINFRYKKSFCLIFIFSSWINSSMFYVVTIDFLDNKFLELGFYSLVKFYIFRTFVLIFLSVTIHVFTHLYFNFVSVFYIRELTGNTFNTIKVKILVQFLNKR